jgi:hypothetical protein
MGDMISNLSLGFGVALSLQNLGLAFLGCLVGTLIGVLPGVGPIATISMLLPITFGLEPVGALIMLAGIYYGAQYGGSTTAILVNIPGEATSVVTALDGHEMARQGRAGVALGIAAIGPSSRDGRHADHRGARRAPDPARADLRPSRVFLPHDHGPRLRRGAGPRLDPARHRDDRAGILMSTVGTDLETGQERMTFGFAFLSDGVDVAVLAMGLFGIAEIMRNLDNTMSRDVVHKAIGRLLPSKADFAQSWKPILRGTFIGGTLGILPGNGAVLGTLSRPIRSRRSSPRIPTPLRARRDRGRRRAGIGQQRRRPDLLHPAPHARHPAERRDGPDGRRHDHPRHRAGPSGDDQEPAAVLGHDRLDVGRQPHAAHHQPAADRALGAVPEGALPADVPGDPDVLLHRHLLDEQRHHGRDGDRRLRADRLRLHQVRLRAGAAAARLRARQADGGEPAPGAHHLARRHDDLHRPPGQRRAPARRVVLLAIALLPTIRKGRDEVFVE